MVKDHTFPEIFFWNPSLNVINIRFGSLFWLQKVPISLKFGPISLLIFGLGTNEVSQRYTIHEVPNLENGPEEFWKSAESSPGAPIQNMGFGN